MASRKRKRKRRGTKPAPPRPAATEPGGDFAERYRERTRAKDDAARAALTPLEEGERPAAVTVAAVVATLLTLGNIAFFVAGVEIRGDEAPLGPFLVYTALMGAMAWGLWRARYWAVLGMEALLGLLILVFSLLLVRASNALAVVVSLAVLAAGGALFWYLVKALARIQMPVMRR